MVVALWAQTEAGADIKVDWRVNYVADSSLDAVTLSEKAEDLRPKWTEERNKFA